MKLGNGPLPQTPTASTRSYEPALRRVGLGEPADLVPSVATRENDLPP